MKILEEITPTKREYALVEKKVSKFVRMLHPLLKDALYEVGGSIAKDTWLSKSYDVDIFIRFPYQTYKEQNISDILEKRIGMLKGLSKLHGSRDYFQLRDNDFTFELIPVLNIDRAEEAMNVTDVSPLHSKWVKENLKDHSQARLFKAFLKANNLYGAESYIKGFSGYLAEVLISHYGTFFDLMKDVTTKWGSTKILDPMHYYESRTELLEEMNKAKIDCPLVVIDPVQRDRNIASALSVEKYNTFVELCKKVLENPSEEWFKRKEITIDSLEAKAGDNYLIILKVSPLAGKEDVVGCRILKLIDHIKQVLQKNDFILIDNDWEWKDEALLWFIVDNKPLPKTKIHYGPPLTDQENLILFKEKWKEHEIQKSHDNKAFILLERQFMDPILLIKHILDNDSMIYENCSRIKIKYSNV